MHRVMRSSGDLIADRRYQYGLDLARAGEAAAAADLFVQALERAPDWAAAWVSLGRARRDSHDPVGAVTAYREALRLDPSDTLGASLELSRLDASVEIDAAPIAYVQGLFNAYAEDFDKALVERLGYATPQHLARIIKTNSLTGAPHFARVLDLGCGTGLAGEAFTANAGWLEGVDLAGAMLDVAKQKGVYDLLACTDILSFLGGSEHHYDLILATDVLIYFGDLLRPFAAVSAKLKPGALFAFSVERGGGAITLHESLRFAHSASYVQAALKSAGLELVNMEEAVLRKDRGADVGGLLVVARKAVEASDVQASGSDAVLLQSVAKLN